MFNVDNLIADCLAAQREPPAQAAIKEIIERAVADPNGVVAALGEPKWAQIDTLYHSPELTILNLIWAPGMALCPHDHRMWAVIGIYGGQEDNTFYRCQAGSLAVVNGKQLETKDTVALGEHVIHSVVNPRRAFTGALHVYGGDFFAARRREWDPETHEERAWDPERVKQYFRQANENWLAEGGLTS